MKIEIFLKKMANEGAEMTLEIKDVLEHVKDAPEHLYEANIYLASLLVRDLPESSAVEWLKTAIDLEFLALQVDKAEKVAA